MCRQLTCFTVLGLAIGMTSAQARLIHHWKLDENTAAGVTVAVDSVGGLAGDIQGATSVPGKSGNAFSFDGSDDVVTIPGFVPPQQGTVTFWIDPGFGGSKQRIFGAGGDFEVIVYSTGIVRNELFAAGSGTLQSNAGAVEPGQWFHIAVTYAYDAAGPSTALEVYVNGELDIVGTAGDPSVPTDTVLLLGHRAGAAGGEYYGGLLDDLRVYDRVLLEAEINALANPPRMRARDPIPPDGAVHEDAWVNLSWTPGDFAVSHDVYLGDSFDDVNSGSGDTFRGNQTATFYVAGFPGFAYPEGLVPGTTYYWRINEVNEADPNSPWKGNIWSFWIPPKTAYNPDPEDGAQFVDPNAIFTWTGGYSSMLHTVYLGDSYDDVNNAGSGMPLGVASYDPGTLEREKILYWRVDEFDGAETHKGDIWSFTTPGAVGNPQPANGAVDVQMIATLSWTPADNAASHELYFGADADAVKNATTASPEYVGPRALGSESYDPGGLAWDSSYVWRVDEVYPDGTVKGLVWSFSTADFILVDDFESYNDIDPPDPNSNRIFDKWIDGFGTTTNGALVGNDLPPYSEQTIVHGGAQSMIYRYDNNLKTSEATLTLVYPRDWTEESVTKLLLWFRGSSANAAERMFVALNGTAVVYHADAAATQITGWNEWVIDLTQFAGVDLTNVDTITLGIGTKNSPAADGGTGTMYFDDIRLVR
ncbi:MAG: LamG-like jellyroll fold domain-containing protein [Planctomycetota bacterium]